ncbi:MAG: acetate--CoA ligase family protein, partial [Pseudonocardia sp.]|nr:acetate--CoA ligase family protein [Pseudonocardia sp.]
EMGTALVVLRPGRSAVGRRAVISHTGELLGDDTAFRLVSQRHGVVLVDDVTELLAAAMTLRGQPRPAGRRIAAVTSSGGAGILAADRCEAHDLTLPELAPRTQEQLARLVPDFGALANPVDVTAQLFNREQQAFGEVCSIVAADPSVDAIMVLLTMVLGDAAADLAEDLVRAVSTRSPNPVPCSVVSLAGRDQTKRAREILGAASIPVFSSVSVAARVASALAPSDGTDPGSDASPVQPAADELPDEPPKDDWALLDALGVARPDGRLVRTEAEAVEAATALSDGDNPGDGRLVLKAVAPGLPHKSDAGGVRLGVPVARVAGVYAELAATVPRLEAVLIQRTAPGGLELLVGAVGGRDGWPPVLTVGLGGTAAEVHRDLASAIAPVTEAQARALLRRLRCWPLLAGHRGTPALDVDAVAHTVTRVGQAAVHWPELAELEINPLIVGPAGTGAVAVDVLVKER